jgi:hypothetical protein
MKKTATIAELQAQMATLQKKIDAKTAPQEKAWLLVGDKWVNRKPTAEDSTIPQMKWNREAKAVESANLDKLPDVVPTLFLSIFNVELKKQGFVGKQGEYKLYKTVPATVPVSAEEATK